MVTHSYTAAAAMERVFVIRDGVLADGVRSTGGTPAVAQDAARLRLVPLRRGD